ncbi:hypothetical protein [Brachyspira sp.]|uniref:hypothetical protein n=1 Tax=Brachyspira sp. TaxID=1977261 RepID=UPI002605B475|nr:hypothetical protein [Brachyspira sp.]
MNKKILSIFIMIMALSLLGVSCNKTTTPPTTPETPTTPDNPGTDPTPEPEPELKDFVSITASAGTATGSPLDFNKASNAAIKRPLTLTVKPDDVKELKYAIKDVVKDTGDSSENNANSVLTKTHFSYDGTNLSISAEGVREVSKLGEGKYNQVKVTITVSATGYNPKDVVVYVKISK